MVSTAFSSSSRARISTSFRLTSARRNSAIFSAFAWAFLPSSVASGDLRAWPNVKAFNTWSRSAMLAASFRSSAISFLLTILFFSFKKYSVVPSFLHLKIKRFAILWLLFDVLFAVYYPFTAGVSVTSWTNSLVTFTFKGLGSTLGKDVSRRGVAYRLEKEFFVKFTKRVDESKF